MMFVSYNSNTTGATCEAGTDYASGASKFIADFVWFSIFSFVGHCLSLLLVLWPLYGNQCLSPLTLWFPLRRYVLDATLCDKVCQWLATSPWFCPDTPVSSTNKTDRPDITEILLKVAIRTITLILIPLYGFFIFSNIPYIVVETLLLPID